MTGIKEALEEIKNLMPGEKVVYKDIAKNMALIAQPWRGNTSRFKLIKRPRTSTNRSSPRNKRRSLSSIYRSLLPVDFHLKER